MDKKEIFISYRSTEEVHARWIKELLEVNNISCWIAPECIPYGSNYEKEIPIALSNCKAVLLVVSKKSQRSKWVRKEVLAALKLGKIISPFFIEDCKLVGIFNKKLSQTKHFKVFVDVPIILAELLDSLHTIIGKPSDKPYIFIDTPEETERKLEEAEEKIKKELAKKEFQEHINATFIPHFFAPIKLFSKNKDKPFSNKTLRELLLIMIGLFIFCILYIYVVRNFVV
ncbi:MAG: toll/interleukin-1 receptor domain-containing protein [Clostridia bacterium]|nr:toll/interleukin-1 receptor domain-containing protein [Clostridia bacterium]